MNEFVAVVLAIAGAFAIYGLAEIVAQTITGILIKIRRVKGLRNKLVIILYWVVFGLQLYMFLKKPDVRNCLIIATYAGASVPLHILFERGDDNV